MSGSGGPRSVGSSDAADNNTTRLCRCPGSALERKSSSFERLRSSELRLVAVLINVSRILSSGVLTLVSGRVYPLAYAEAGARENRPSPSPSQITTPSACIRSVHIRSAAPSLSMSFATSDPRSTLPLSKCKTSGLPLRLSITSTLRCAPQLASVALSIRPSASKSESANI